MSIVQTEEGGLAMELNTYWLTKDRENTTMLEVLTAKKYVLQLLWDIKIRPWLTCCCDMDYLYEMFSCDNRLLYLALHELVEEDAINGHSPYLEVFEDCNSYYSV
jgi:hypothetical protein